MDDTSIRVDRSIPGVRVVTENLPWCAGAAVGLWIDAGSVDEAPDEHGAAHFLEHVLFKGTSTRSGLQISQRIDELGGDLNAFTGREHTCFHVHVPAEELETAVDVLVDVVARGTCADDDVDLERQVILDELAARGEDLEDLGCDLATEAVLGDDPLGRSVIGTPESVSALDGDTLRSFHRRSLRRGAVVVAAAGRVDHDRVVRLIAEGPLPGLLADAAPGDRRAGGADDGGWAREPALVGLDEDSDQVQFVLARRTPARSASDRAAAQVATAVLGGGLSSRLFQHVREERGLAYSVYSSIDQYRSTGVLTVVAACPVDRAADLAGAVGEVVTGMDTHPPDAAEVARAVGHLTGSIRLTLDDPMSRMMRIGRHMVDRDTVVDVETSLRRLREVDVGEVVDYWSGETAPWCLATLGPDQPHGVDIGAARLLGDLGR